MKKDLFERMCGGVYLMYEINKWYLWFVGSLFI